LSIAILEIKIEPLYPDPCRQALAVGWTGQQAAAIVSR
jgi:hypothetical protein